MLRPAIQADLLTFRTNFETELGSDHYFFTERSERFACEFFVRERTVHFSGIEKRHTLFKCRSNQRNHLLLFRDAANHRTGETAPPADKVECGDAQRLCGSADKCEIAADAE